VAAGAFGAIISCEIESGRNENHRARSVYARWSRRLTKEEPLTAQRTDGPIAVFGCGLVGASLAAAWSGAGCEVWGCDRRDLQPLRRRGWIARQVKADELREAAVVVLALPPAAVVAALERFPFRPGQLVTDTSSVKSPAAAAARRLPAGVEFIGGHPLAGGTGSGFEGARADLVRGAVWVLLPGGSRRARARLEALVRLAGAEPVACGAERHDRIVALTSHLPQLLSTVLAAELAALDDPLAARLLGPGGAEFLRLAASPADLWREILCANRDAVASALAAVTARAAAPPETLDEDFRAGAELLAKARRAGRPASR
jgi:prephenate dehydrogenase